MSINSTIIHEWTARITTKAGEKVINVKGKSRKDVREYLKRRAGAITITAVEKVCSP